jgi:CBS-domain-containing membrane protein
MIAGIAMRVDRMDRHEDTLAASTGKDTPVRPKILPWRLFDQRFLQHSTHYISQCLLATLVILVVLLMLDTVKQTVLISALGASTFICFTMPHVKSSGPRYLVGGYIVGTSVGVFVSLIAGQVVLNNVPADATQIIFAAIATGLAIFCMVITDTEHPPAAALALGYVLNEWSVLTIAVVLAGVFLLSMTKESVKKYLIDLL